MHARSIDGIRARRKWQTRRIMKMGKHPNHTAMGRGIEWIEPGQAVFIDMADPTGPYCLRDCGYRIGDTLLVAEAWRTEKRYDHLKPSELPSDAAIEYIATGDTVPDNRVVAGRYRNARFMLNRLCRIRLPITDIRVEFVQDISDADVLAEGVLPNWAGDLTGWDAAEHGFLGLDANTALPDDYYFCDGKRAFQQLWDATNGDGAWERNDRVWVYEFDNSGVLHGE